MDPGRQIYLSNNKQHFWSKMIFEQQNQKKISEKKIFFQKKIWEKQNLGKKILFGKKFERNFFVNFK